MSDQQTPPPGEEPSDAKYLWCSDCRAPLSQRYYALNERPICGKCRPPYVEQIARTDGPGATWRVGMQGAVIAIIGVVALTLVISAFPPGRIFLLVPIGYFIGKRMMTALAGYSKRRYQYTAVSLTYLCFLAGFTIPAVREADATKERMAANRAKTEGTMARQSDAVMSELSAMGLDTSTITPKRTQASQADVGPGPALSFVIWLLLPFFAQIQFGIMFSAVGVGALGYALYQAWDQTDGQGRDLLLSGPFRVGEGPILPR